MSEIPGLPSPSEEWKTSAYELRMEQARLQAEENESKIWKMPLEGALYWAKKNQFPAAGWLHSFAVRNRRLWVASELIFWSANLAGLLNLILRFSLR